MIEHIKQEKINIENGIRQITQQINNLKSQLLRTQGALLEINDLLTLIDENNTNQT